jgi:hypothetical protein
MNVSSILTIQAANEVWNIFVLIYRKVFKTHPKTKDCQLTIRNLYFSGRRGEGSHRVFIGDERTRI